MKGKKRNAKKEKVKRGGRRPRKGGKEKEGREFQNLG